VHRSLPPARVLTIANGVDTERFQRGPDFDPLAVKRFCQGDVRQAVGCCRAMPVLHARRRPYDIPWPDLLLLTAFLLHPAYARRHNERLTQRMSVPGGSRARRKGDASASQT